MPVTLKNVSKRMQSFNLASGFFESADHDHPHGFKLIHVTLVHQNKHGKLFSKRIPRMVCSALHFAADEERADLPKEVLDCPEIKGAIERGWLRVTKGAEDKEESSPPTVPGTRAAAAAGAKRTSSKPPPAQSGKQE